MGGPHIYYYRSRGSYIIVVLEYIITLEHNKLLCLRTFIIVIINCYTLDKTSALDQPCYQWGKLLPSYID
jgi:hypothetical protein